MRWMLSGSTAHGIGWYEECRRRRRVSSGLVCIPDVAPMTGSSCDSIRRAAVQLIMAALERSCSYVEVKVLSNVTDNCPLLVVASS